MLYLRGSLCLYTEGREDVGDRALSEKVKDNESRGRNLHQHYAPLPGGAHPKLMG